MRRRKFLNIGLGISALGALAYSQRNSLAHMYMMSLENDVTPSLAPDIGKDICILTPEQIEGPYYIKSPIRSELREDKDGLPLSLTIEVINAEDCTPLEGYTVEIWHCDTAGNYSGYGSENSRNAFDSGFAIATSGGHIEPIEESMFLRGGQVSDQGGRLTFETIFPGWYELRVTHIHVKVSKNGQSYLTTQVYFPDDLIADIYSKHPDYVKHGPSPYNMGNDFVLGDLEDGAGVVVNTKRSADKIEASFRLGIPV